MNGKCLLMVEAISAFNSVTQTHTKYIRPVLGMLLSVMNPDALDSLVMHKSRMQNVELKECDCVDHAVLI